MTTARDLAKAIVRMLRKDDAPLGTGTAGAYSELYVDAKKKKPVRKAASTHDEVARDGLETQSTPTSGLMKTKPRYPKGIESQATDGGDAPTKCRTCKGEVTAHHSRHPESNVSGWQTKCQSCGIEYFQKDDPGLAKAEACARCGKTATSNHKDGSPLCGTCFFSTNKNRQRGLKRS